MQTKSKLPTILGIILLIVGTFLGVFLINNTQTLKIGASAEKSPKDVRISNITDNSFTVSWVSDIETIGYIMWGDSQTNLTNIENGGQADTKSITHYVNVTGLMAGKTYYYKIYSDGTAYDNQGIPWKVQTGPQLTSQLKARIASGSVITSDGKPVDRALVYLSVNGYVISTTTSASGSYILQLGGVRTNDLTSYQEISPDSPILEIFVEKSSQDVSSAQVYLKSAQPVPPIIIGQTLDFKNNQTTTDADAPDANLNLPADAEEKSKFDLSAQATPNTSQKPVTLKTINDGETITSTTPEFGGDGPKGETLKVLVESENPMTADVKVAADGTWKWAVPEGLAEGAHKITLTWIENGITRTLTRNFIVHAGEAPAFEASSSGSLATSTPSATTTSKATATSKPTATASAVPVPETGSLTGTLILSIMGILAITLAFFNIKYLISNE